MFVRGRFPHVGPVLGPTSAPDAPTQVQVAHVKPNLRSNMPKLRHVGPVGLKLGPSWSQLAWVRRKLIRPKLARLWPNLGQGLPSLTPVSHHESASFLSVLFTGCGRHSSRSNSNNTLIDLAHCSYCAQAPSASGSPFTSKRTHVILAHILCWHLPWDLGG